MPLTLLVRGLGDLPADVEQAVRQLRFRNTILVYLNVDSTELFKDQWLYVHSPANGFRDTTRIASGSPRDVARYCPGQPPEPGKVAGRLHRGFAEKRSAW